MLEVCNVVALQSCKLKHACKLLPAQFGIRQCDNDNGKYYKYVCTTTNQPDTKCNPNHNSSIFSILRRNEQASWAERESNDGEFQTKGALMLQIFFQQRQLYSSLESTQGRIQGTGVTRARSCPPGPKAWKRLLAPRYTVLPWHGSTSLTYVERIITAAVTCLAIFLENRNFSLYKFRSPKWWKMFVVPGGPGPYRGLGPEASAPPASWMWLTSPRERERKHYITKNMTSEATLLANNSFIKAIIHC